MHRIAYQRPARSQLRRSIKTENTYTVVAYESLETETEFGMALDPAGDRLDMLHLGKGAIQSDLLDGITTVTCTSSDSSFGIDL